MSAATRRIWDAHPLLPGRAFAEVQEAVEERYMLDDSYAALREEVEMDLVDAYAGETLGPLQRQHFERSYLVTEERREAVKAAYLSRVYRERIARPAARAPLSISLGESVNEVTIALGQPRQVIDLVDRKIYVYKDMKITFSGGKVTNIQ
jgi:hypothetical protein